MTPSAKAVHLAPCRSIRSSAARVCVLLCLVLGTFGCKGGDSEPSTTTELLPPIPEHEAERGVDACTAYVERVCACAQAKPENTDMVEQCDMAPAKLSSLNMVLRVNRSSDKPDERAGAGNTARRIMASCITAQGDLDSLGCPRAATVP